LLQRAAADLGEESVELEIERLGGTDPLDDSARSG
jgi:hypothetical protein